MTQDNPNNNPTGARDIEPGETRVDAALFKELVLGGGDCFCCLVDRRNPSIVSVEGPTDAILGVSPTEILSDGGRELARDLLDAWNRNPTEGRVDSFEFRRRRPDGMQACLKVRASGLDGEIAAFVCRDIAPSRPPQPMEESSAALSELVGDASRLFLEGPPEQIASQVTAALEMVGKAAGADRCYLFEMNIADETMRNTYEWCAPGISPQIDMLQRIDFSEVPWWSRRILDGHTVAVDEVEALPDEAAGIRRLLLDLKIKSVLCLPVTLGGGELYGFIGFDAVTARRRWDDQTVKVLTLFSQLLAGAIARARRHETLQEAVNRAEAAIADRDVFANGLATAIRTPLASLLGMSELLLQETLPPPQADCARSLARSADTLSAILKDLLTCESCSENPEITPEPMSPAALLKQLQANFEPLARAKGLCLLVSGQETLPETVLGDQRQITRILETLLTNALKFTGAGLVELNVAREGDRYCFTVCDTGSGIKADRLGEVFSPRNRRPKPAADETRDQRDMGLNAVRKLAAAMDAEISADSREGRGSLFRFVIELPSADSLLRAGDARQPAPATILVVEDNLANRKVLLGMLKRLGIARVVVAENGRKAVEAVEAEPFDLIFMDLHMPELGGLEAARLIRAMSGPAADTPIVALTADIFPEVRRQCLEAGMNNFAGKPFSFTLIRQFVKQYTSQGDSAERAG